MRINIKIVIFDQLTLLEFQDKAKEFHKMYNDPEYMSSDEETEEDIYRGMLLMLATQISFKCTPLSLYLYRVF